MGWFSSGGKKIEWLPKLKFGICLVLVLSNCIILKNSGVLLPNTRSIPATKKGAPGDGCAHGGDGDGSGLRCFHLQCVPEASPEGLRQRRSLANKSVIDGVSPDLPGAVVGAFVKIYHFIIGLHDSHPASFREWAGNDLGDDTMMLVYFASILSKVSLMLLRASPRGVCWSFSQLISVRTGMPIFAANWLWDKPSLALASLSRLRSS